MPAQEGQPLLPPPNSGEKTPLLPPPENLEDSLVEATQPSSWLEETRRISEVLENIEGLLEHLPPESLAPPTEDEVFLEGERGPTQLRALESTLLHEGMDQTQQHVYLQTEPGVQVSSAKSTRQHNLARRLVGYIAAGIDNAVHRQGADADEDAASLIGMLTLYEGKLREEGARLGVFEGKETPDEMRQRTQELQQQYGDIIRQTRNVVDFLRRYLVHLGGENVNVRIATTLSTLVPFVLVGEARKGFDFSQTVLWWLRRTSRIDVGRYGEIKGKPQDESLRNESSSFPLAVEFPPGDLASLITRKLTRYAANEKEYHLDDTRTVVVLIWQENTPRYLELPLQWFSQTANLSESAIKIRKLLAQMEKVPAAQLTAEQMEEIYRQSYGKFSDQSPEVRQILHADLAFVLDDVNIMDPQAVMRHKANITGGAAMRETVLLGKRHIDEQGRELYTQAVVKSAHAYRDAQTARQEIAADLENLEALMSARSGGDDFVPEAKISGFSRKWVDAWRIAKPEGGKSGPEEYIGYTEVSREQSQYWLDAVGVLRLWHKERGVKFGLADLFSYMQMLATRSQGCHFVESHEAEVEVAGQLKKSEVLDVAFNALPEEFIKQFDRFAVLYQLKNGDFEEAWREFIETDPKSVELALHTLLRGLPLFVEERKRAKEGRSVVSFISTLAGSVRWIEKIIQFASGKKFMVGEKLAQAVASPDGGMVSVMANIRKLIERLEGEVNWLWFGSANADIYQPFGDQVSRHWGGNTGVSNVPGGGYAFLNRSLSNQAAVPRETEVPSAQAAAQNRLDKIRRFLPEEKRRQSLEEWRRDVQQYEGLIAAGNAEEARGIFPAGTNVDVLIMLIYTVLDGYSGESDLYDPQKETQAQTEEMPLAINYLLRLLALEIPNLAGVIQALQEFQSDPIMQAIPDKQFQEAWAAGFVRQTVQAQRAE